MQELSCDVISCYDVLFSPEIRRLRGREAGPHPGTWIWLSSRLRLCIPEPLHLQPCQPRMATKAST